MCETEIRAQHQKNGEKTEQSMNTTWFLHGKRLIKSGWPAMW